MQTFKSSIIALCVFLILGPFGTSAQVRLPQLIADNMVLQRDKPITIWGWASPSEKISGDIRRQETYKTVAAADSSWQIRVIALRRRAAPIAWRSTAAIVLR